MFESTNLPELAHLAQSVITANVISGSRGWRLTDDVRRKIRVSMFGRHKPDSAVAGIPPHEQKELLEQFASCVAAPVIQLLPVTLMPEDLLERLPSRESCDPFSCLRQ